MCIRHVNLFCFITTNNLAIIHLRMYSSLVVMWILKNGLSFFNILLTPKSWDDVLSLKCSNDLLELFVVFILSNASKKVQIVKNNVSMYCCIYTNIWVLLLQGTRSWSKLKISWNGYLLIWLVCPQEAYSAEKLLQLWSIRSNLLYSCI